MFSKKATRRWYRRTRRRVGGLLLRVLGPTAVRLLAGSWKLERVDPEHLDRAAPDGGSLATLWHGRMLMPLFAHRNQGNSVLVSPSDDGSLTTGLLARFGYGVIRGSSNRNPARALREMLGTLRRGSTVVITPDGPRGPRHSINPGTAWLARATGLPIVPVGIVTDRAWRVNSWDAFTIPKWGARVLILYGEPIWVGEDADDEEVRRVTEEIRSRMIALEERGFRMLGVERDW